MTKENVFELLEKAISYIGENFNAEERDIYLDEPLKDSVLPFEYSIDSGISKAVILIKGEPYVIKMPFFKIYDEENHEYNDWEAAKELALENYAAKRALETNNPNYILTREEIRECEIKFNEENPEPDIDSYSDIEGASNINLGEGIEPAIPDWDYCRLESVLYQLALEEGLGAYFAEEGYLGTIDQTPVYYQTRCTPMSTIDIDYNSKEYKKKSTISKEVCEKFDIYCFDEVWIADFIKYYGEKEFKRFNDFLNKYEIEDLRRCNIGYLDDAPILFDYSGYRGW